MAEIKRETKKTREDLPAVKELDNLFSDMFLKLNQFRKNIDNVVSSLETVGVESLVDDTKSSKLQDIEIPTKTTDLKIESTRSTPLFYSMIPMPVSGVTKELTYTPLNVPPPIPVKEVTTPIKEKPKGQPNTFLNNKVPIEVLRQNTIGPSPLPKTCPKVMLTPRSKSAPSRRQMLWYWT
ncbi:uncharacterized protein LOC110184438 [Drosophila serrata]|uniref:uncharacterized protein LOC110184438 n=1 Tax=Drosophila serrata TaxID=7274 RepID=UPI000A1D393A|nr:uncharacterized protein LOC110184438 [Drosophila serrata]KAH8356224.1 hypothetical protein KR200_011344 [Drosophila serrata]